MSPGPNSNLLWVGLTIEGDQSLLARPSTLRVFLSTSNLRLSEASLLRIILLILETTKGDVVDSRNQRRQKYTHACINRRRLNPPFASTVALFGGQYLGRGRRVQSRKDVHILFGHWNDLGFSLNYILVVRFSSFIWGKSYHNDNLYEWYSATAWRVTRGINWRI